MSDEHEKRCPTSYTPKTKPVFVRKWEHHSHGIGGLRAIDLGQWFGFFVLTSLCTIHLTGGCFMCKHGRTHRYPYTWEQLTLQTSVSVGCRRWKDERIPHCSCLWKYTQPKFDLCDTINQLLKCIRSTRTITDNHEVARFQLDISCLSYYYRTPNVCEIVQWREQMEYLV